MNVFKQYTINSLKKNKVRTIVTIIGIILSVAMFTATTEALYSVQNFLIEYTKQTEGSYHIAVEDINDESKFKDLLDDGIENTVYLRGIGYAEIASKNDYKPYLYIAGIDKNYTDMMPISLTEGRLPENSSEIVVAEHIDYNGGVELKIGDTLDLEVGERVYKEQVGMTEEEIAVQGWERLTQNSSYHTDEETLVGTEKKTYTVVGFCSRPGKDVVEPYSAPGYTAYTIYDGGDYDSITAFMSLTNPTQYEKYSLKFYESGITIQYPDDNRDLLTFSLYAQDEFTAMFVGLGAVLIVLIIIGSISLIYNTFSISVSERTKQFGILKSIGATKKQMRNNVLFEALVLCLFGVPIGLISGCVGIAITFKALGPAFSTALGDAFSVGADNATLKFVFSPLAILAAAAIGILTVVTSAYIPAIKAIRITPIESIRQSKEVKVKRRSVRISPLTKLIFGFEGMVSAKYFKRNRRKYRVTVMSLFMSVVMFISASSLAAYFTKVLDSELDVQNYDLQYRLWTVEDKKAKEISDAIADLGFEEVYFTSTEAVDGQIFLDSADKSILNHLGVSDASAADGMCQVFLQINYVPDDYFREILEKNGIDEEGDFDKANPKALFYDNCTDYSYDESTQKIESIEYKNFSRDSIPGEITVYQTVWNLSSIEGYEAYEDYGHSGWETTPKGRFCTYTKYEKEEIIDENGDKAYYEVEVDTVTIPWEKASRAYTFDMGAELTVIPSYINFYKDYQTLLLYPESVRSKTSEGDFRNIGYIIAEDHNAAEKKIRELFRDYGVDEDSEVYNIASDNDSSRALVLIAKVLAYGFITLISLIAAANVFNTVSTNIALRRREIATLMSVGLTKGGLRKMMFYESLIYGLKSLVFSLPVSTAVTYLIYKIVAEEGASIEFFLPTGSYIFAIVSVFAVVLVTMAYSLNKIGKENIIESLRNENI